MKIRRNWWKSTRIIVTQWVSVRIGENYYKSIRITKNVERSGEKVFPRKKMFEVPRWIVSLLLLLLLSYQFWRGHLREKKKVPLAVDVRLLHTARIQDGWQRYRGFFVEIRRSFEIFFLLKMTIYMHSASQFPVFVVSVVRSLGFLRQKKFSTRIKGDARFFIVDAL